jgi:pimeloyl-ACP methyl ester carboxylesterase
MVQIEMLSLKIPNRYGDNLVTDFRFMKTRLDDLMPLVIFCHGFKGFKDWGCFPYMLDKIAAEGNFVVSFNFSYNGVGEEGNELNEFTRLDRFAENTFTRELEDLESIIDYLENHREKFLYDLNNIVLIGHSRGGGIVILQAAKDKRIRKLITLASVSTFDRYSDRLKEDWKKKGYWEVLNSRTGQMMRMNVSILEDFERNNETLNIEKAAEKINIPWLIIHGTEDLSVDYSNAETLYAVNENGNSKLKLLENIGHTFGAVHPFQGTTPKLEEVILLINEFIKNST